MGGRPPVWRSVRGRRVLGQLVFLGVLATVVSFLWRNLVTNMRRIGQTLDFSFLDNAAEIRIAGTDFRPSESVASSLVVGIRNTVLVSLVGIVLAMLIGLLIGIARLSTNWLVAHAAAVYVETVRNIPVLVIIFFWSAAVILKLPRIDEPLVAGPLFLSNRGLWVPWIEGRAGYRSFLLAVVAGVVLAVFVGRWRTRFGQATGRPPRRVAWGAGVVVGAAAIAYAALGGPVDVTLPSRAGRAITGGLTVRPEFAALLAGLVVYTASHIAEIVRGSIQAVSRGQTEASAALGLSPAQRLRLVVLPQAMRIALPQLANQFLNLTKNSSLGIAVAYAEIMTLSQINIANRAPAPQTIALVMSFYLLLSLTIAGATNVYNRRMAWAHR